jgi:hypothetical protein
MSSPLPSSLKSACRGPVARVVVAPDRTIRAPRCVPAGIAHGVPLPSGWSVTWKPSRSIAASPVLLKKKKSPLFSENFPGPRAGRPRRRFCRVVDAKDLVDHERGGRTLPGSVSVSVSVVVIGIGFVSESVPCPSVPVSPPLLSSPSLLAPRRGASTPSSRGPAPSPERTLAMPSVGAQISLRGAERQLRSFLRRATRPPGSETEPKARSRASTGAPVRPGGMPFFSRPRPRPSAATSRPRTERAEESEELPLPVRLLERPPGESALLRWPGDPTGLSPNKAEMKVSGPTPSRVLPDEVLNENGRRARLRARARSARRRVSASNPTIVPSSADSASASSSVRVTRPTKRVPLPRRAVDDLARGSPSSWRRRGRAASAFDARPGWPPSCPRPSGACALLRVHSKARDRADHAVADTRTKSVSVVARDRARTIRRCGLCSTIRSPLARRTHSSSEPALDVGRDGPPSILAGFARPRFAMHVDELVISLRAFRRGG